MAPVTLCVIHVAVVDGPALGCVASGARVSNENDAPGAVAGSRTAEVMWDAGATMLLMLQAGPDASAGADVGADGSGPTLTDPVTRTASGTGTVDAVVGGWLPST